MKLSKRIHDFLVWHDSDDATIDDTPSWMGGSEWYSEDDGSSEEWGQVLLRQAERELTQLESCDLCDDPAEYRQCQKCMNDKFIGSHTDEEFNALETKGVELQDAFEKVYEHKLHPYEHKDYFPDAPIGVSRFPYIPLTGEFMSALHDHALITKPINRKVQKEIEALQGGE